MVLKLYGANLSSCTRRVALVLQEKEVPYEFVAVDLPKGEHKAPDYLKKHPFGQVPYIDDDGFILFESRAICRYIAAKYPNQGTALIPGEIKACAKFEQAASIEMSNFDGPVSGFFYEKLVKKFRGLDTDEERAKEHLEKLSGKLDAYEVILSKQKYLAGDEVTLADLFHLPTATTLKRLSPETFTSRPHLAKWLEALEARPAWVAIKDGLA